MVAIVSGNSLGLNLSSLGVLGANGQIGNAGNGRHGENAYVNAATGNLVLQVKDGLLVGLGDDVASIRTYNSQGVSNFTNDDGWQNSQYRSVVNIGNNVLRRTDSDGSTVSYTWNATNQAYIANVAAGSAVDTITVNGNGTYAWKDGATGATQTYANTGSGLIQASTDADGNAMSFTYDANGLLTQVTDANGESVRYTYSGRNLTGLSTYLSGNVVVNDVTYAYDTSNRLSSVSVKLAPNGALPAGSESLTNYLTTYTYDGTSDRIASVTQSDGTTQSFTYVLAGGVYKVASATDGLGNVTQYAYNATTRTTTVTDPLGASSVYVYDTLGQLTQVRTGVTSGNSTGLSQVSYTYNSLGNVASITSGTGNAVTLQYDAKGNLTSQVDASGQTRTSTYNAANQLLTDTTYAKAAGAQAAAIPETTRYVYSATKATQLRFVVSASGNVTEYVYGSNGLRTTTIEYSGGRYNVTSLAATAVPTEAQMQTWRGTQDLTQSQRVNYAYDFRGQLQTSTSYGEVNSSGVGVSTTAALTQYVYNQRGELIQTIAPLTATVTQYVYDGLGRLVSVSAPSLDGVTANVQLNSYNEANAKTTLTLANGLSTISTFDKRGLLVSVVQSGGGNANLGTTSYSYDKMGNLLMTTDPSGLRQWMFYDAAGRKIADVASTGALTEYVYDANSQITRTVAYATAANTASLTNSSGVPQNAFGSSVTLASIRPAATAQDEKLWNIYDNSQRLVWQINAKGQATLTEYDGNSRISAVTQLAAPINVASLPASPTAAQVQALATFNSATDRTTTSLYDSDGRLMGTIDAEGFVTEQKYDAAGRLVATIGYFTKVAGFTSAASIASAVATARSQHSLTGLVVNDARNYVTNYIYNDRDQLVGEVDAERFLTETVYTANGQIAQQIRYAPRVTGQVDGQTVAALRPSSAGAQVVNSAWNAAGKLSSRTSSDGTITQYTYDSIGQLIATTVAQDPEERRTLTARYDLQGRLVAELGGIGSSLLTGNQTAAQVDAIWAQYGVKHTYDAAGRRMSTTDAEGHRTLFFYDRADRLTFTVNAMGEVKETRYNTLGQLTDEVTYGTAISMSALTGNNAGGLVNAALQSAISSVQNTSLDSGTRYTYDSTGAVMSITDALGAVSSSVRDAFGAVVQSTRDLQAGQTVVSTTAYDRRGLAIGAVADVGGIAATTSATYDAFGRQVSSTDANGNVTQNEYDRHGRLVQSTDGASARYSTTVYDAFDRILNQYDIYGTSTQYTYDSVLRRTTVTSADGATLVSTRNAHGQLESITDGNGNTTTYTYDADGNLLSTVTPLTTTSSEYDKAGRLTKTIDANGTPVTLAYDAANRLLSRTVDPAGLNLVTTYQYDAKGEQIRVTDPRGIVTETSYDLKGEVLTQRVDPTGLNLLTTWSYDKAGRTLSVTAPSGTSTQYVYDRLGRRTSSTVDPTGLQLQTTYAYDDVGNMVARTDPNGNLNRFTYTAGNRLRYEIDSLGAVTEYTYDSNGRNTYLTRYRTPIDLTGLAAAVETTEVAQRIVSDYSADYSEQKIYDSATGRLGRTIKGLGDVTDYSYDDAGNLTTTRSYANFYGISDSEKDLNVRTVYDQLNRAAYTVDGTGAVVAMQYDGNGNVTDRIAYATRVSPSVELTLAGLTSATAQIADPATDTHVRAVYDAANRLTWSADGTGAVVRRYYDADGNVTKQVSFATTIGLNDSPQSVVASAADRQSEFVYDRANRVTFELTATSTAATGTGASGVSNLRQFSYDRNGNVIQVVDRANLVADSVARTESGLSSAMVVSASLDRMTVTAYDAADRAVFVVDPTNVVTRNTYDAKGQVVATTRFANAIAFPNGATGAQLSTAATVANITSLLQADAARDRMNLTGYDANGRVTFQVDPLGFVTSTVYNGLGQVTVTGKHVNAAAGLNAGATAAQIDAALPRNYDADKYSFYSYDQSGNLAYASDALGNTEAYVYNALGQKTSYTNTLFNTWNYEYDAAGRLIREFAPDPSNSYTGIAFRTLSLEDPYGGGYGGGYGGSYFSGVHTLLTYDAFGNLSSRTEGVDSPNPRTTSYEYDKAGRQIKTIYPPVGIYNPAGDQPNSQSAGGAFGQRSENYDYSTSQVIYDAFGDAVAGIDVGGNVSTKAYDKLGRVAYEVDALGYVTSYQRNSFGDVLGLTRYATATSLNAGVTASTAGGSVPGRAQVAGAIVAAAADRTVTTSYDRLGRALETTQPAAWVDRGTGQGAMVSAVSRSTYDAFGQIVQTSELADQTTNTWATTTHYFDRMGHEFASIDAMGYLTTRSFDSEGNVLSTTEYANATSGASIAGYSGPAATALDRTTTFAYDRLNRKVSETRIGVTFSASADGSATSGNVTTTYTYDSVGNNTSTTDALGNTSFTYYDSLGRIYAVAGPMRVGPNGATIIPLTMFTRDVHGNIVQKTEYGKGAAWANQTDFAIKFDDEYAGAAYGGEFIAAPSDRSTYIAYDNRGRAYQTFDSRGVSHYISYDAEGRVAKSWQDVMDLQTGQNEVLYSIFQYDALGRQTAIITPGSTSAVDGSGAIVVRDQATAGSVTTGMTWNAFGEMVGRGSWASTAAAQYQEQFEYDSAGRLWRTNSDDGTVKVMLYDLQGNQTSQLTSAGSLNLGSIGSAQAADQLGNAGVRRTDMQRDLLGRVLTQVMPQRQDITDNAAYRPAIYMTYDRWGNALTKSDVRNGSWITQYTYNANNQVILQVQPDGSGALSGASPVTQIYYDAVGQQVAVRDANGHVNGQVWSAGGQLIAELHADGGVVSHRYDIYGQQTRQIDAMGRTIDYVYDGGGNNVSTSYKNVAVFTSSGANVTQTAATSITSYNTYDAAGRRVAQMDGTGSLVSYKYDLRGNVIATTDANGFTNRATFDAQGRQTASQDANGALATWGYDVFGQLTAHTDIGGAGYFFSYDSARQLIGQGNSRGKNIGYSYDAAGQLTGMVDYAIDQTTTYAYNAAGQRVLERTVQSSVTHQDQVIGYDTLGRQSYVTGMDAMVLTTDYDAVGNKLHTHASYGAYLGGLSIFMNKDLWFAYDSMNRQVLVDGAVDGNAANLANLTATQGHLLAYDLNGNRIQDKSWGTQIAPIYRAPAATDESGVTYYDESSGSYGDTVLTGYATSSGLQTQWYVYDSMNRLASVSQSAYARVQTGVDYNTLDESNQPVPVYANIELGRDSAITLDTRLYDGASRVVRSGPNGALEPLYVATLTNGNTNLPGSVTTTTDYDNGGRVLSQTVVDQLNTGADYTTTYQFNGGSGYDAAGNVLGYRTTRTVNGDLITTDTAVQLQRFEGYEQAGMTAVSANNTSGSTTSGYTTLGYNANGFLNGTGDSVDPSGNRAFVNDAQGRVLTRTDLASGMQSRQLVVNGEVVAVYGMTPQTTYTATGGNPQPPNSMAPLNGAVITQTTYVPTGAFNLGYQPVTNSYPSAATGSYPVRSGDTLKSIAQAAYGDSSLWYLIADANALKGDADLRVGQILNIPTRVGGVHNNSTTYAPYDPAKIVGDTSPQLPVPPGQQDGGCGAIGQIIMIVVAVAVTYLTAGAAAQAGVVMTQVSASSVAAAAGAAAAGSIASQVVGNAIGAQDGFSWKNVAVAAISGGITQGIAPGTVTGDAGGAPVARAAQAAVSSAATQAALMVVGLQSNFSWSGVAASAVGAGVGAAVAGPASSFFGNSPIGQVAASTATGFAAGVTTAALRGGRVNVTQVATDAFGNALGSSLAYANGQRNGSAVGIGEQALDAVQGVGPWSASDYRNGSDIQSDNYGDEMYRQQRIGQLQAQAGSASAMAYGPRSSGGMAAMAVEVMQGGAAGVNGYMPSMYPEPRIVGGGTNYYDWDSSSRTITVADRALPVGTALDAWADASNAPWSKTINDALGGGMLAATVGAVGGVGASFGKMAYGAMSLASDTFNQVLDIGTGGLFHDTALMQGSWAANTVRGKAIVNALGSPIETSTSLMESVANRYDTGMSISDNNLLQSYQLGELFNDAGQSVVGLGAGARGLTFDVTAATGRLLDNSIFVTRPTAGLYGGIPVDALFGTTRITTVTAEMSDAFQGMGYVNPLTNKFTAAPFGETIAVDHIFPSAEIVKLPGFNTLTKQQMTNIIQDTVGLDNLQPLPKSFNSSKGSTLDWTTYRGQALDPGYASTLAERQVQIQLQIRQQIQIYQQQNLLGAR